MRLARTTRVNSKQLYTRAELVGLLVQNLEDIIFFAK